MPLILPLATGGAAAAAAWLAGRQAGFAALPLAAAALALAMATAWAAAFLRAQDRALWLRGAQACGPLPWAAAGVLLPFLLYAWGTASPWVAASAWPLAYAALAMAPALWRRHAASPWAAAAMAAWALALWIPFDERWPAAAWPFPAGHASYLFAALMLIAAAWGGSAAAHVKGWAAWCPRFSFRVTRAQWRTVAIAGAALVAVVLPLGWLTGFLGLATRWPSPWDVAGSALYVAAVIALPEELIFRGLVQEGLTRASGKPRFAVATAAVLFGLSHYNNTGRPDVRYLVAATLAGVAYGRAYRATGQLWPAVALHAAVDVLWAHAFPSPHTF